MSDSSPTAPVLGGVGTVLGGTGGVWRVRLRASGDTVESSIRGRLKKADMDKRVDGGRKRDTVQSAAAMLKLAVGDEVVVEPAAGHTGDGPAWAIAEILPRRSKLARREPGGGHGERVVVANVDQVVIVFAAANPEPHPRMLDRFLVIAEGNALHARVVINKAELTDEHLTRERFADYERAGYPVHYTSAKIGLGMNELHEALLGRTSALSGPSGVGKSSLLNALYPGLNLRVGEISESVNKGRHTTVGALLHPLPDGGFVADTPGLREIGMWGLEASDLDRCYREFQPLLDRCRFNDCTHRVEPGCEVRDAVADGRVSAARYDSYLKLREELESAPRVW